MIQRLKPATRKVAGLIMLLGLLPVTACDSNIPPDRAGEGLDDVIEEISRKVDDACDPEKDRDC